MKKYSEKELEEALNSLNSTLSKCEKAMPKLKENSAQHTLMVRRVNSFRIAISLVERELE